MPTLKIRRVKCYETEHFWGADDVYLKVEQEIVWGPTTIHDHEHQNIEKDIEFSSKAVIELWAKGIIGSDDHLGTNMVYKKLEGRGEKECFFHAHHCNYRLIYEVV